MKTATRAPSAKSVNVLALLKPITAKEKAQTIAENTGAAVTSTLTTGGSVVTAFGRGLKKGFGFEAKPNVGTFKDPDGKIVNCEIDSNGKPVRILN